MEESNVETMFGFHLDAPKVGETTDGPFIDIHGWALARQEPAVAVEIVAGDRVTHRQAMNVARPDLATAFPEFARAELGGFGFSAATNGQLSDEWILQAVLANQKRVPLATISLTRAAFTADAPLVSVVIPSFNHSPFLSEAIESVLRQNYPKFEILVIDDGSTDNTSAVTHRYPTARLVRQKNAGLAAARNAGVLWSRGEFLVFLDADDRLLPNALEAGMRSLETQPQAAFTFGQFQLIDLQGRTNSAPAESWYTGGDCYRALLRGNFIAMHATVMYRRAMLPAEPFDPSLPSAEDYDLYLRLASCFPVASHTEMISEYRQHGSNMSHDDARMLAGSLCALNRQRSRAKRSPELRRAFSEGQAFWRNLYGDRLVEGARRDWREHLFGHWLRNAATLVWYYPAGLRKTSQPTLSPESNQKMPAVDFGDLRRTSPITRNYGASRGRPIDRHYIETFLGKHAADIRGRVLEIGDNDYTIKFGNNRVSQSDILHIHSGNPRATIIADLSNAPQIPDDTFDCVILTQTLQCIFDVGRALETVCRILKPGGVALITVPCISQIADDEWGKSWYWNFTPLSVQRILQSNFAGQFSVESHGNVLAATAFFHGMATEELSSQELSLADPAYPMVICARAKKVVPEGNA